jgi:Xaa-Pro aminopeptidase
LSSFSPNAPPSCRRPLHARGARAGRHRRLRAAPGPRGIAGAWIAEHLPKGGKLGFDPWLQTVDGYDRFAAPASAPAATSFRSIQIRSTPCGGPPAAPLAPVLPHPVEFAGESSEQRRRGLPSIVRAKGADVALITQPDSIAWLLNVRGGDVPRTPFALGFALLHSDGHVDLYMDRRKVPTARVALAGQCRDPGATRRTRRRARHAGQGGKKRPDRDLDGARTGPRPACRRAGVTLVRDADPVALPKACKNAVETGGHPQRPSPRRRRGQSLPGLAGARIERRQAARDRVPRTACRRCARKPASCAISRSTPSPAPAPTAPSCTTTPPATERTSRAGSLYLVDSGGQYRDGTTDITRTVAIGTPTPK